MSAKRKKRKRRFLKPKECVLLLLFFAVFLYSLIYAIDCSISAGDMDACLADAYEGRCVEISQVELYGRHGTTLWLFLKLDNGVRVGAALKRLEKAGLDVDELERLRGETMRFSYTTVIGPWPFAHYPIDISYQGRHLTSTEVMAENLRSDASGWYFIAGLNLFLILLFSPLFLMDAIGKFFRERKHQKNRRRKAEKKQAWLEKQKQNEQLPDNKGE